MPARPFSPPLLAVLLTLGCAEWPLYADLPGAETDGVPAPDDLRSLVEVDWEVAVEAFEVHHPEDLTPILLAAAEGHLRTGTLRGLGWRDQGPVTTYDAEACDGEVPRHPIEEGDWIADVDLFLVEVTEPGQLCAEAHLEPQDVGWDLLVAEADPCGRPEAFLPEGDSPLGFGLGGPEGGWGIPVPEPGRYLVLFAAYQPIDRDLDLPYNLGLSVVPAPSGGGLAPCPLLPNQEVP